MADIPEVVHVGANTELAEILDAVGSGPVSLEYKGKRYRLIYEQPPSTEIDAIVQEYDAERFREALREAAGSWSDIDAEEMKRYIYEGRESGTRSDDRHS